MLQVIEVAGAEVTFQILENFSSNGLQNGKVNGYENGHDEKLPEVNDKGETMIS